MHASFLGSPTPNYNIWAKTRDGNVERENILRLDLELSSQQFFEDVVQEVHR